MQRCRDVDFEARKDGIQSGVSGLRSCLDRAYPQGRWICRVSGR